MSPKRSPRCAASAKSPSRKRGVPRTTHPLARARGSLINDSHPVCHGRPGRADGRQARSTIQSQANPLLLQSQLPLVVGQ